MTSSEQDALIAQAHDVFDSEYRRLFPQGGDAGDHDEALQSALVAVAEFVQADQTRRIVEWLREEAPKGNAFGYVLLLADIIEREFSGVTQPEEDHLAY